MAKFERGLSRECSDALRQLAKEDGDNWWKDVLASGSLLLTVRGGYLNAYSRGQSIFKIGFGSGSGADNKGLEVQVHYKYLIEPNLEAKNPYVPFDGRNFKIDPSSVVRAQYDSGETLKRMIQTASRFSEAEKTGVHQIAYAEPKVVDLEIAFTRSGDAGEKSTAPRMDLALLVERKPGEACLVFCEAKCADNVGLWRPSDKKKEGKEALISVVEQVNGYEEFIRENETALRDAYLKVCRSLTDLREQGCRRKLDELVRQVADEQIPLSVHPHVYLLVFGFDADQKKGALKKKLDVLGKALCNRIIAKGKASSFSLAKDIGLRERSSSK